LNAAYCEYLITSRSNPIPAHHILRIIHCKPGDLRARKSRWCRLHDIERKFSHHIVYSTSAPTPTSACVYKCRGTLTRIK
jgi:hypothetical protein